MVTFVCAVNKENATQTLRIVSSLIFDIKENGMIVKYRPKNSRNKLVMRNVLSSVTFSKETHEKPFKQESFESTKNNDVY